MCGIIGILSHQDVVPRLMEGLRRLEYRGYDSAGIATLQEGGIARRRAEGKIAALQAVLDDDPIKGVAGIGHTRWATHGAPSTRNAHPHSTEQVAVVHNGIIENFLSLRGELETAGHVFETDTDTEILPHLLSHYLAEGHAPEEATRLMLSRLKGAYALAILFAGQEDVMMAARAGSPLVLGVGEEGAAEGADLYVSSDALALSGLAQDVIYLEEGDVAVLQRGKGMKITDGKNQLVQREKQTAQAIHVQTGKEQYRHFMEKEIHEQPAVLGDVLHAYDNALRGEVMLPPLPFALEEIEQVTIVACGTSYYAGMVMRYWLEALAGVPVQVEIASEFRYRAMPLPAHLQGKALALCLSQSGETADTLAALRVMKTRGWHVLAMLNNLHSTMAREADRVLPIYCGPEIGVASTKAFTAQLAVGLCLCLAIARAKEQVSQADCAALLRQAETWPAHMAALLERAPELEPMAARLAAADHALYVARGALFPVALEGALKLKEISYIHAEGAAAGELKHGPIALVDQQMPVVALAMRGPLLEKTAANIREIAARGGQILLMGCEEAAQMLEDVATEIFTLPTIKQEVEAAHLPMLMPLLYTVPLQLLAYQVAVRKGCDVDQPRNLAKSVTVE